MAHTKPPSQGDLIEVSWIDILEDLVSDPRSAKLARRTSIGYLWEEKEDQGVPVLVTTQTWDKDGPESSGYTIYPKSCVLAVKVIRRKREKKEKVKSGSEPTTGA